MQRFIQIFVKNRPYEVVTEVIRFDSVWHRPDNLLQVGGDDGKRQEKIRGKICNLVPIQRVTPVVHDVMTLILGVGARGPVARKTSIPLDELVTLVRLVRGLE